MPTTTDIRRQFLDFFASKDHAVLPSSSLVPHNDPTLMFTAAGMVQFKNIFSGTEKPASPRAATAQKCVRAGGKHNDLDNVGYTARHHTFFEMLGNFSFGDYFKEGAISHAWELMTKVYGIPAEKLGVTVYHTDDEAFELWKKIAGLPDSKILRVPTKDNFWAAGDTGPCGPCTEIFYDHGKGAGEWKLDATGHDMFGERYVEIWNLVFMQYEALADGSQINLPKPSIDTGMGLERLTAVLQGVTDNYDTDLFKTLIAASQQFSKNTDSAIAASHRVIADHLRSTSFLIADGVLPSNEGRGYVLRRIMRRAMRHAHMIGCTKPLMHQLVPTLIAAMGAAYPELKRAETVIADTLKLEEEKFKETLERGLKLLDEEKAKLLPPPALRATSPLKEEVRSSTSVPQTKTPIGDEVVDSLTSPSRGEVDRRSGGGVFPGIVAFKLYDTYGFPLDLTQDILRAEHISVDMDGFNAAMAEQKAKARAAWKGSGQSATAALWFDIKERVGATEFLGYAMDSAQGVITALIKDGAEVSELKAGDVGAVIVNQTPFYGESGGQVGDSGTLASANAKARVSDTSKQLDALFVHEVTLDSGALKLGDTVELTIDTARRNAIRANHSATHLLHAALREQLGEHITQKGSLVDEQRLRFDVTNPKAIAREELARVEKSVNHYVGQKADVSTKLMNQADAIAAGAMALFGEKYGAEVRVLAMGKRDDSKDFSVELCGGTHVSNTGEIGLFKIVSEGSVSSGVRRIEAVTGENVRSYLSEQLGKISEQLHATAKENARLLGELKKTSAVKVEAPWLDAIATAPLAETSSIYDTQAAKAEKSIAALQDENKKLNKELAEAKKQAALGAGGEDVIETIGGTKLAAKILGELDAKSLRDVATAMHQKHADAVSVLLASFEGKGSIIVAVGKELAGRVDAPTLVKAGVAALGGQGGGGRPDFAQGGGPDGAALEAALGAVKGVLG
jgi:alanyl-tRNA synthetase